jgi:hypothetical protein
MKKIKVKKGEIEDDAIDGVEIWELRRNPLKVGRPRIIKTPEQLWSRAEEYFNWVEENPLYETKLVKLGLDYELVELPKRRPMTLEGLCGFLGVNTAYFRQFDMRVLKKQQPGWKKFATVLKVIKDTIRQQKYEGAATGFFSERMIMSDLGMSAKKEIDHTSGGEPVQMAPLIIPYDLIKNSQNAGPDEEE